jgi:hypothetical protein
MIAHDRWMIADDRLRHVRVTFASRSRHFGAEWAQALTFADCA